jgi:SAM-dependent methyltransferase
VSERWIFDPCADEYTAVRRGYVPELIDDVVSYAALGPDDRVLEVGCGPGTATVQLAPRVPRMTCLEPGPQLAALAREAVRDLPHVEVVNEPLETWDGPEGAYALIAGARSFHWIAPDLRFARSARLLRPRGALALWWHWPRHEEGGFIDDVQEAYDRWWPRDEDPSPPPRVDQRVARWVGTLEAAPELGPVEVRRYPWQRTFDAETYVRLMNTWSDHRALPHDLREGMEAHVTEIIERSGGAVVVRYETALFLTRTPA